ncbi:MAG: hypothetical protein Q7S00_06255, partial [bacterium]|nr:hypothetical protein [bacterium]
SFKPLNDNAGLTGMSASRSVFPGVEIRFNQNGRVAFGVGYQRWSMDGSPDTFFVRFCQKGGFCSVSGSGNLITHHPRDGKPLLSSTNTGRADVNVIFSTVYFNLVNLADGKIRPFLGFGGGILLVEKINSWTSYIHPDAEEVVGFKPTLERPEGTSSENFFKPMVKGVAGVNIFPGAHTMFSISGGYSNGKIVNFGFGFVF